MHSQIALLQNLINLTLFYQTETAQAKMLLNIIYYTPLEKVVIDMSRPH